MSETHIRVGKIDYGIGNNVISIGEGLNFGGVSDLGAQANAAYAALPTNGGHIVIIPKADGSSYNFSTPIIFATAGKYILFEYGGAAGAVNTSLMIGCLNYTPSTGVALTLDYASTGQTGQAKSSAHGMRNITLINNQCQTPGGCGGTAVGIDIGNTNEGIQSAAMENVSVIGFSTGFRNRNFFSDPVSWVNPQFWNCGVGWDIGNVSTTAVFGGYFNSNTQAIQADNASSRSEMHFHGTSFVANSLAFNYLNVTGLPAYLFLNNCHFENGGSASASAHYIQGNVDVFISGGVAEDDSSSGTSDSWFAPTGNKFVIEGMSFNTNSRNPTVGIVDCTSNSRVAISAFNANPSNLTNIVGGTNAANATVRMFNGNITNTPSVWSIESVLQHGGTKRISGANFTTSSATLVDLFVFNLPPTATTYNFECVLIYQQATSAVGLLVGVQSATVAPTYLIAHGRIWTTLTGTNTSATVSVSNTTATTVLTGAAPNATGTNYEARMFGSIESPANAAGNVFKIQVATANASDAILITRGSYCTLY